MKQSPEVIEAPRKKRLSHSDLEATIDEIVRLVAQDEEARIEWLHRQANYYKRRYCRLFRHTEYPWPGASDVVMPTIDMTIDRLKSTLSRVIFTRPMVTFEARGREGFENARSAEVFFNWLITEHIPDFKQQIIVGLDQALQYGFTVFKNYWHFETRNVSRVIRRSDLPREFLQIAPGIDEREANQLFIREGKIVIPRQEIARRIDASIDEVKRGIAVRYGLDEDEKLDRDAIDRIVRFFRNAEEEVRYQTKEIIHDTPRTVAIDPQDIVVPRGTCALQDSERITHRIYLTESQFLTRARDNEWSTEGVNRVLDSSQENRTSHVSQVRRTVLDFDRDLREGLVSAQSGDLGVVEIYEHYFHMDIDGDGYPERCSCVLHPGTKTLLRDIREIPFEHAQWPFSKMGFELNDLRFYSPRGVPEKIDDIDKEITERHRAKLNKLDLLVPAFTYRFGSEIHPDRFVFQPGAMFPVMNEGDLSVLEVPDQTIPEEREENILLTWNQRYLGGLDTGLADQQNISEARTATEIQAIQRSAGETLSFRAEIMQLAMKDIYGQLWDLWNQWGPESIYVRVTGSQYTRMTKEEIRGDFNIVPVGTVTTTDPVIESQRALARLQALLQVVAAAGPTGLIEWEIDLGEALARYLQRDNQLDALAVMRRRSPEQIQAIQQQIQQKQQLVDAAETNQPQTIPEAMAAIKEIEKRAPHRGRQRIASGNGNLR